MSAPSSHRRIELPLGTISIRQDADGGETIDAHVSISEAKRIARLGGLPEELYPRWTSFLRGMLIMFYVESTSRDKVSGIEFTHRKLLDALKKLSRSPLDGGVPEIQPWLKGELPAIERQRLLRPDWGPSPISLKGDEESERAAVAYFAAVRAAHLRVERSLTDVEELRALAHDLHGEVSARPENTREYYARKRALDPGRTCIANDILQFWTGIAGKPLRVTKPLIAMTSAAYKACRLKMSFDAVKKQLHESAKRRRNRGKTHIALP